MEEEVRLEEEVKERKMVLLENAHARCYREVDSWDDQHSVRSFSLEMRLLGWVERYAALLRERSQGRGVK